MAQKRFGKRDIEARIGRTVSSGGTAPAAGSGGNSTFFVSVLSVFIAGGAGSFLVFGGPGLGHSLMDKIVGPQEVIYKSRVADVCDRGWKDDRMNRDQIHCYMTRDVRRLCDSNERRALVERLHAYQVASNRWSANLTVASLGLIGKPGVMAMGMAEAESRDPRWSPDERAAQFNKTMDLAHDFMAPADKVLQASVNEVSRPTLVADVKDLAGQGFLKGEDFPEPALPFVKEGVAAAGHDVHSPCR